FRRHALFFDGGNRGRIFAALAVEQRDAVANRQTHDLDMTCDSLRQCDDGAEGKRLRVVKAGHVRVRNGPSNLWLICSDPESSAKLSIQHVCVAEGAAEIW